MAELGQVIDSDCISTSAGRKVCLDALTPNEKLSCRPTTTGGTK